MSPFFVAVGHNGLRVTSSDGKSWSAPQLGKDGETYRCAAGGNGCVAVVGSFGGSNIFASTTDGATWKTSIKDAQYSRYIRGLGFGNGFFLALGGDPGAVGVARPFVLTSLMARNGTARTFLASSWSGASPTETNCSSLAATVAGEPRPPTVAPGPTPRK